MNPYRILERKRAGERLSRAEITEVVRGSVDGSWSDAQIGAFLMAVAIRGLGAEETRDLTLAMIESGEQWRLRDSFPGVVDKHSTGGVGDKVSLILAPLLAACDVPVAMLTGRSLGHTAGTADKLESIPGMELELDRRRCLDLLERTGVAVGIATASIAPADRRLYAIRDTTATVSSLPLVIASILSKKLATGAAAIAFDVKSGDGAVFPDARDGRELAERLVSTSVALGVPASALLTDMSQPLGAWVGHTAEVMESVACLRGDGEERLMAVTLALCLEVAALTGRSLVREQLAGAIASGRAYEAFERWILSQGAAADWVAAPRFPLAPREVSLAAPRAGLLARVHTRRLGLLLGEASRSAGELDHGVALHCPVRLGERVEAGQELARLYLRSPGAEAVERELPSCFEVADEAAEPALVLARVAGG